MRKKQAVGVGLVAVVAVAGPLLTIGSVWLFQPSLRDGMTDAEVSQILGAPDYSVGYIYMGHGPYPVERYKHYPEMVDALGNRTAVLVYFDDDERVTSWKIEPLPRTRPPWLDRAMKAVGW